MSQNSVRLTDYLDFMIGGNEIEPRWQKRFYVLHLASEHQMARIEGYEDEHIFRRNMGVIVACYCELIQQVVRGHLDGRYTFQLKMTTSDVPLTFACRSEVELEEWLAALHEVIQEKSQVTSHNSASALGTDPDYVDMSQTKRKTSPTAVDTPIMADGRVPLYENVSQFKEKDVYESLETRTRFDEKTTYQTLEVGRPISTYDVDILETEASKRCNLIGSYKLQLRSQELTLLSADAKKIVLTWPYKYIRRFTMNANTFTFEAGRKCDSGEGLFYFRAMGNEIFAMIQLITAKK